MTSPLLAFLVVMADVVLAEEAVGLGEVFLAVVLVGVLVLASMDEVPWEVEEDVI